jgi:DNA repair protein RecO (recombination protein O)
METKTRAFSLGGYAYGEGDRLVLFYSRELGKIKASAKGVRKSLSKLSPLIEIFNESEIILARRPGAEIYRLVQGRLADSRPRLKERLASISALQVLSDVMRSAVPDGEPNEDLYRLLLSALDRIGLSRDKPEAALTSFLLRFLDLGGYPLALETCAECGKETVGSGRLSVSRGGWVCTACDPHPAEGLKVTKDVLWILRKLRHEGTGTLPSAIAPSAREAFRVTADYLCRAVETELGTVDYFLRVTDSSGPVR